MTHKRDEYPINEPVFPNLDNCGLEIEEAVDREFGEHMGNYRRSHFVKEKLPTMTKEWTNRWMYMTFKYATDVDENKRVCQECYPPGTDEELIKNEDRFTKGHL